MRSQLRNWDSKITFFAFADIITAVSGMLIFITLLLATDLGRPAGEGARSEISQIKQQLLETLAQQEKADAQNSRLQDLLSTAETAPDLEKLQADVARLHAQLVEEQTKQTAITGQIAGSQVAAEKRDARLGLADLSASIQRVLQEAQTLAARDAEVRGAMANLESQVDRLQSTLLKLRQREGQLWLIPDKSATTKEPILVTVAGAGATIERFDHPEQRLQLERAGADAGFRSYLSHAKTLDQYVVFLLRPSGIVLFQDLVKTARGMGFEVGYDALEENQQIHFSTPPPVEESSAKNPPSVTPAQKPSATGGNFTPPAKTASVEPSAQESKPQPAAPAAPPPPKKSWWQRLLEWLGLAH